MKNNNKFLYVFLIVLVFFCGCATMYGVVRYIPISVTKNVTKLEKDVTVTDEGIADAVEKVYDAVVVVTTYNDERAIASGTGFIYKNADGYYYVLTNYHVIENGNKVNIKLTSKETIETDIVGYNKYADIAVLSFKSDEEYTVASLGKSEDARIGDTTFAVGAPLDSAYSWTVTRGILSGKDREVEVSLSNSTSSDYVMLALQTDAAINSGNSGGPLCNSNGEVIGITSMKLVSSGVEGMGFAIPIDKALNTAEKIMAGESDVTPYLGIGMRNLTEAYYYPAFRENIQKANITSGVAIQSVEEDSPAEKAGIKVGDIIVKINDQEISNIAYLRYALYNFNIGDTIKVSLYRDGDLKEVDVKLSTTADVS